MRLRLVVGISCLPLLVAGCFSNTAVDDTSMVPPGDDGGPDAEPGSDATIPLEAAAPEASTPEANTPEAAPTTVTVVVVNDHGPEQGATVVFQDATGNVVTTAVTDASGRVTQVAAAGSQVTAVLGTPQNIQLVTIEGVMPGDVLTAHDATDTTVANGQVSIDALPEAGLPPGTGYYRVNIGRCSTDLMSLPIQVQLYPDCESGGTFPVLVQAMDQEDQVQLGFTYQNGNAFPLDGGTAHLSLDGAWSTASPSQSITAANFTDPTLNGFMTYSEIADGVAFGYPTYFRPDSDAGVTNTFAAHPGYATSVQNEANVNGPRGNNGLAISAVATRTPPSLDGGAVSLDLSTLLPLLDAVTLDSSQPGQPLVSWTTEAGSLASANGSMVMFSWSGSNDGGDVEGTWTIVAPPTATSVRAPALPAAMAAWAPSADATFPIPNVIVIQGSFLPDYAQVRALFSTLPATSALIYDNLNQGGVVPPLPVDGTLRLTAFTTNED